MNYIIVSYFEFYHLFKKNCMWTLSLNKLEENTDLKLGLTLHNR